MSGNKAELDQLAQDGATDGQAVVWSASLGKWVPGTISPGGTPVSASAGWFDAALIDAKTRLSYTGYAFSEFIRDDMSESLMWPARYSAAATGESWRGPTGLHQVEAIGTVDTGYGSGPQQCLLGGTADVKPLDPTQPWYIACHVGVAGTGSLNPIGSAWIGFIGDRSFSGESTIELGLDASNPSQWYFRVSNNQYGQVQTIYKGSTTSVKTLVAWFDGTNYNFTVGLYSGSFLAPTTAAATVTPTSFMGKYQVFNLGDGGTQIATVHIPGYTYTYGYDKFIAIQRNL